MSWIPILAPRRLPYPPPAAVRNSVSGSRESSIPTGLCSVSYGKEPIYAKGTVGVETRDGREGSVPLGALLGKDLFAGEFQAGMILCCQVALYLR